MLGACANIDVLEIFFKAVVEKYNGNESNIMFICIGFVVIIFYGIFEKSSSTHLSENIEFRADMNASLGRFNSTQVESLVSRREHGGELGDRRIGPGQCRAAAGEKPGSYRCWMCAFAVGAGGRRVRR